MQPPAAILELLTTSLGTRPLLSALPPGNHFKPVSACSMVAGPPVLTRLRIRVIPITPPLTAIFLITSSVLQRRRLGTNARQFECVTSSGFWEASKASNVVRSPWRTGALSGR